MWLDGQRFVRPRVEVASATRFRLRTVLVAPAESAITVDVGCGAVHNEGNLHPDASGDLILKIAANAQASGRVEQVSAHAIGAGRLFARIVAVVDSQRVFLVTGIPRALPFSHPVHITGAFRPWEVQDIRPEPGGDGETAGRRGA